GWNKAYRFVALRYAKDEDYEHADEVEQYQLFETRPYRYRVFVTNLKDRIPLVVWFYNQRAGAENLIKEANNDAGLAAHPSGRFDANRIHFQLAMLSYNLNAWLLSRDRDKSHNAESRITPSSPVSAPSIAVLLQALQHEAMVDL